MEVTFSTSFCSHGSFVKSAEDEVYWFERTEWSNQYGSGVSYELNLIWFRVSLESYKQDFSLQSINEKVVDE